MHMIRLTSQYLPLMYSLEFISLYLIELAKNCMVISLGYNFCKTALKAEHNILLIFHIFF